MSDTVRTMPSRQEPYFSRSFDYSEGMITDTTSVVDTAGDIVTGSKSFILEKGRSLPAIPGSSQAAGIDWIFWALLGAFLLLAAVKYQYEKRFRLIFQSLFSRNTAQQLIRESGILSAPTFPYYFAIFLIASYVFIYQSVEFFSFDKVIYSSHGILSIEILGAYLGFVLLKFFLMMFASLLFKNPGTASENIQNIIIFNLTGGMLLLPLLLLSHYSSKALFLNISIGIISILLIIKLYRSFLIGLADQKFSLFHLFLYLCTLEILPILVIAKFIDKYFFS